MEPPHVGCYGKKRFLPEVSGLIIMPAIQLHLFEPHKPLAARLGSEFFSAAPAEPGVYIMTGKNERVLYIGQSKNLRARLGTYKNARLDRAPRKTVRLVHEVERISYETCLTAEAARLRENELLRTHRPRFNRVNTYPRAYTFIFLREFEGGVEIGRTTEATAQVETYGAFKAVVLAGFAALLRTVWSLQNKPRDAEDFPLRLFGERPPKSFLFEARPERGSCAIAPELLSPIRAFLAGESEELVRRAECSLLESGDEAVPAPVQRAELSLFQRGLYAQEIETLKTFFRAGPERNLKLRRKFRVEQSFLGQDQLDDLMARGVTQTRAGARETNGSAARAECMK